MAWELDDNVSGALHFAGVALLVLVLPLVLLGLSDRWDEGRSAEAGNDLHAFRNGYLGLPPDATVPGTEGRASRLTLALAASLGLGAAAAGLAALFPASDRFHRERRALRLGRPVFLALALWGVISALCWPMTYYRMEGQELKVTARPGWGPWVWPMGEEGRHPVEALERVTRPDDRTDLVARTSEGVIVIGTGSLP